MKVYLPTCEDRKLVCKFSTGFFKKEDCDATVKQLNISALQNLVHTWERNVEEYKYGRKHLTKLQSLLNAIKEDVNVTDGSTGLIKEEWRPASWWIIERLYYTKEVEIT